MSSISSLGVEKKIGDYILSEQISDGAHSQIYQGTHIPTGEKVAIKVLNKSRLKSDSNMFIKAKKEISIFKKMFHKNIIKLYEIMETLERIYLVMEFCDGGDLFNYILSKGHLTERQSCKFFHDIIEALSYLHSQQIAHRDIKLENILIDTLGKSISIKLIDFGISNNYKGDLLKTSCGTSAFAAPEIYKGKKYDGLLCDIWSAGIVLYSMVFGYLPFSDENEQNNINNIVNGKYEIPDEADEDLKDLLSHIIEINPEKRFNLEQIKNHKWYNIVKNKPLPGIIIDKYKIPIDERIVNVCQAYGYDKNKIIESVSENYYDNYNASYYIILGKFIRERYDSISDLFSQEFLDYINDPKNIIPENERKKNNNDKDDENFDDIYSDEEKSNRDNNEKKENNKIKIVKFSNEINGNNKEKNNEKVNINNKSEKCDNEINNENNENKNENKISKRNENENNKNNENELYNNERNHKIEKGKAHNESNEKEKVTNNENNELENEENKKEIYNQGNSEKNNYNIEKKEKNIIENINENKELKEENRNENLIIKNDQIPSENTRNNETKNIIQENENNCIIQNNKKSNLKNIENKNENDIYEANERKNNNEVNDSTEDFQLNQMNESDQINNLRNSNQKNEAFSSSFSEINPKGNMESSENNNHSSLNSKNTNQNGKENFSNNENKEENNKNELKKEEKSKIKLEISNISLFIQSNIVRNQNNIKKINTDDIHKSIKSSYNKKYQKRNKNQLNKIYLKYNLNNTKKKKLIKILKIQEIIMIASEKVILIKTI